VTAKQKAKMKNQAWRSGARHFCFLIFAFSLLICFHLRVGDKGKAKGKNEKSR
jgi:hypothetical protein